MREIDYKDFNENTPKSASIIVNNIKCDCCGKLFSKNAKTLRHSLDVKRGKQWEGMKYCSITCFNKHMHNFSDWRLHNSEAQKIAQNKPEQKIKNSEGVKRSRQNPEIYKKWYNATVAIFTDEYCENMRKIIKNKWDNDEEFRNNVLDNNKFFTSCHGIFHSKNSGEIRYESSYELLFLFLKDLEGKNVKRFDIAIEFEYNGNKKYYIPDFVCEGEIFEIKSNSILKKKGDNDLFEAKQISAKKFVENSDLYNNYKILFDEDFGEDLRIRDYLYSWLVKDGFITDNYGGKYLERKSYYTRENGGAAFKRAKELYLKWNLLK